MWSCSLSTGGQLFSHTESNSSSMFTSPSRSQVRRHSCVWKRSDDASDLMFRSAFSRRELGFLQAGSDLRECSQQRPVSDRSRGSRQELQVDIYSAFTQFQMSLSKSITNADVLLLVRPQILAMTGSVRDRPALLDLANCFTKTFGLCLSCEVFVVRFT